MVRPVVKMGAVGAIALDASVVKMGAVGAIGCICTLNDIGKPMVRSSTMVPLAHY
jgi:hypothetical protein